MGELRAPTAGHRGVDGDEEVKGPADLPTVGEEYFEKIKGRIFMVEEYLHIVRYQQVVDF